MTISLVNFISHIKIHLYFHTIAFIHEHHFFWTWSPRAFIRFCHCGPFLLALLEGERKDLESTREENIYKLKYPLCVRGVYVQSYGVHGVTGSISQMTLLGP